MLPAALQYDPNHADAHNNLGVALNEEGRLTEAIECFHQALRCNFGHAEAHNNLGAALMHMGLHAKALEHIGQALRINPAHGTALWNRSLLRLRDGDFEHGWPDYEYRWTQPGFAPRYRDRQRWDGSSLTSKSILVYADQGLGDTIQFVRYLPLVKERGATVIFECQSALIPLLSSGLGADRLIPVGAPVPPFDVEAPLLSLPGIFCTTFATIPAKIPYLRADPSLVEYWRNELEPLGGFKIGIAWQGNPKQPEDRYRSFPMTSFGALARVAGVQLVSLQKGPGTEQLHNWVGRIGNRSPMSQVRSQVGEYPIFDLGDRLDRDGAFLDTAAVMNNLNLVVAVDSAVAHLAGALGIPVWVPLPLTPDWRWLLEREDSPWYPTMRLFRQSRFGEWDQVFMQMAIELNRLVEASRAG
jgi:hypothetical protein